MSHEEQKNLLAASTGCNIAAKTPNRGNERFCSDNSFNTVTAGLSLDYFSANTAKTLSKIHEIESGFSTIPNVQTEGSSLDERLFDARANVKILISQISMHVSPQLREKLFHQIDLLHNPEEWEDGDDPINMLSFKTFLRWFYLNSPEKLPSFGLSSRGNFVASWIINKDRLILEFLPNDSIKWFVTKHFPEGADHGAGTTSISRSLKVLAPYTVKDWFSVTR